MIAEPESPKTVIHDRGYESYRGGRETSSRLPVVALATFRRALAQIWVKISLLLALFPPVVVGVMFYVQHALVRQAPGALDELAQATPAFYVLHLLVSWYGALFAAFTIALSAASPAIADDLQSGALPFYLTRPLSRSEYLGGKWIGAWAATLLCTAGALLFSLFNLSLAGASTGGHELVSAMLLIPRTIALCLIQTGTLTTVAVALSAVTARRSLAQAGLAALFFFPWLCGSIVAHFVHSFWPGLLSLPTLFESVGRSVLGLAVDDAPTAVPPWIAAPVLLAIVVGSGLLAVSRIGKVGRG